MVGRGFCLLDHLLDACALRGSAAGKVAKQPDNQR
jgi:hypothetical protein